MDDTEIFKNFAEYLHVQHSLESDTVKLIIDHSKVVVIPKDSFLLGQGQICKYVYFIFSGKAISFLTGLDGKASTWFFHFNGCNNFIQNVFAVDYKSFLSEDISAISIKTLSTVVAIQLSKKDVNLMLSLSVAFDNWIRTMDEKIFILTKRRTLPISHVLKLLYRDLSRDSAPVFEPDPKINHA
ncbi:CRP-like cAMP-binding protein [Pedobacter sp. UYP30]|uniref:Crp/Fnr family transcriptional regulator n=1 Tax=Pedobacter sp. UYP30 TaxID=1756400 RepID=UPI00339ACDB7